MNRLSERVDCCHKDLTLLFDDIDGHVDEETLKVLEMIINEIDEISEELQKTESLIMETFKQAHKLVHIN